MTTMTTPSLAHVVAALGTAQLLEPAQLKEVANSLQTRFPDPEALVAELVRRGWLTAFQAEHLRAGRAEDLVLGPYLLLEQLGQGGMGEVFKARHQLLNRVVALKVTREEVLKDPLNELRFLREIQATAQLSHPNIVVALDAVRVGDRQLFAMEYIEGTNLAKLVLQKGPLPVAVACDYVRQAALGLQHAFEHGLVHRDIKPANLLVTAEGAVVKVADLGVVRREDGTLSTPLTTTGTVIGTPDYLAPEQASNSSAVDIRADLYSLGCTFYFLLTGQPPFPEGQALEKLFKHVQDTPLPVRALRPDVPAEVEAVVQKLLAKRPDDRYQQPAELAAVLGPLSHTPGQAAAEPATTSLSGVMAPRAAAPAARRGAKLARAFVRTIAAFRPRRRVGAWVGAILLAGAGAGVLFWHASTTKADRERKPPITNSLGMQLARAPAGEFTMGSPADEKGRQKAEGPPHAVVLSKPFYLAVHETTVRDFRAFVEATKYLTEAEKDGQGALRWNDERQAWEPDPKCTWRNPGWPPDDEQPVVCVSRHDALAFCYWLGRKEGKTYRLPTEAEWEYACRAGTTSPFAGGPALSAKEANCNGSRPYGGGDDAGPPQKAARVGSYAANAWGLYDLHGNVWEWCADYYSPTYYQESPKRDPRGPEKGSLGVLRGGSWQSGAGECRSAARLGLAVSTRRNDIGFRVVLEAEDR